MYYQTKPTEVFRERELALLEEAEKRRLLWRRLRARRSAKARSTIVAAVVGLLGALVVASLMLVASSGPAHASTTFTVDNIDDPGDGFCNAQGCTLRDAILAANSTSNSGGPDLIKFDINRIPGGGPHIIKLNSELPDITDSVMIDGYSQPGSSPNTLAKGTNAKIMVELSGGNTLGGSGLHVKAPNVVIRGLNIHTFAASGIIVGGSDSGSTEGVKIEGNFIGTDPTGTLGFGNGGAGVLVADRSGVTIGGASPATRNLLSDNSFGGVSVFDTSNIKVLGNLIGTDKSGTGDLGNSRIGVKISRSANTLVGGATSASANTIAFNAGDGVGVSDSASTNNRVLRNSVFRNDGFGIDLLDTSEDESTNVSTANDPLDPDAGPNGMQNRPVITSAKTASAKSTIKGRITTKANQSYVLRFFLNPKGNEGKKFIGQKKVTTGSDGKGSLTFTPTQKVGVGKTVTATATGSEGTSEFSAPKKVVAS